jgi:hypothetical protein
MNSDARWWMMLTVPLLALAVASSHARGANVPTQEQVEPRTQFQQQVSVADVHGDGTTLSGRVLNTGQMPIQDVQVLVHDSFRWANEFHPGSNDPGRATMVTVPGPIPPGGSAPFTADLSPRPPRNDGHFVLGAEVLGFTELQTRTGAGAQSRL